jgi:UDP-N-acetylmuramoyl-L-alanyl-D-glutamate--2,6-diaminopimelate ligase
MTVTLASLRGLAGVQDVVGDDRTVVKGVCSDSRRAHQGDLFAVISGATSDGGVFIDAAVERGACAVLAREAKACRVATLLVDDVRKRLGPIAHCIYGDPTSTLRVVGVTGTNGKTTVSYLVEGMLAHSGAVPALMGTVALRGPLGEEPADLTTPEADVVARFAAMQLGAAATHLVLEASSHALEQGRLNGTRFEVAAFTNLSQDHLDYHGTFDAYGASKARLFREHAPKHSVLCIDGTFGASLAKDAQGDVCRCSVNAASDAEIRALHWRSSRAGIEATVHTPEGELELGSPLFGAHNLENLLVALGIGRALGLSHAQMRAALAQAKGAPGRMERVHDRRDVLVLVDYAHTPDALTRALEALRPLTTGRLIVVCGCGGDRDRSKRPRMGEAAARGADLTVLTSDNPRTEEPSAILNEMEGGAREVHSARLNERELTRAKRGYIVIEDRRAAIQQAIQAARAGDTVLLAGKGHEPYQIVGQTKHAFDDRLEAHAAVAAAGGA